jgi:hypothetical protein
MKCSATTCISRKKRLAKGRDPFFVVICDWFARNEALELYRRRWDIETFSSPQATWVSI